MTWSGWKMKTDKIFRERKEGGKEKKDQKFIFGQVVFGEIFTWLMVRPRLMVSVREWKREDDCHEPIKEKRNFIWAEIQGHSTEEFE